MTKVLVFCFILISSAANAQLVVQINAGSRASWGTNQNLFIDKPGHCTFFITDVKGGPVKDSASFNIPPTQVETFLNKAEQVGFFNLNNRYDGGLADGSGIFVSLNSSGKKYSVTLINKDIPEINQLIAFLNQILEPHNIRIYYGQSSSQ